MNQIRPFALVVVLILLLSACAFRQDPESNLATSEPTAVNSAPFAAPEPTLTATRQTIPFRTAPLDPVNAQITAMLSERRDISSTYPAMIDVEVAGNGVSELRQLTVTGEGGGRQILIDEIVTPPIGGEKQNKSWPAGVHELAQIWIPEAYYLTNGTDGMFVTASIGDIDKSIAIAGQYRANEDDTFLDVELIYSGPGDSPDHIRAQDSSRDLLPVAGAEFLATNTYLDDQNAGRSNQTFNLTFDDEGRLVLEKRSLEEGVYDLIYLAETAEGQQLSERVSLDVASSELDPDRRIAVHPSGGFQISIPSDWSEPVIMESWMKSQNSLDTIELAITIHPEIGNNGSEALSGMALQQFGAVSILYQDLRSVGERIAHRTVYAYETDLESHTGIFATLVNNGTGYVVDLDGQNSSETELLGMADSLLDSWQFRVPTRSNEKGNWLKVETNNLSFYSPSTYLYEQLDSGWDRITSSDGRAFVALRLEGKQPSAVEDRLRHWQRVAEQRAPEFAASEIQEVAFLDLEGMRFDFEYLGKDNVTTYGFVLALESELGYLFVWGEAPEQDFDNLIVDLFMPVIASLSIYEH